VSCLRFAPDRRGNIRHRNIFFEISATIFLYYAKKFDKKTYLCKVLFGVPTAQHARIEKIIYENKKQYL